MSLANTLLHAMEVMQENGIEVRVIRMTRGTADLLAYECRIPLWAPMSTGMFNGARIEIDDGRKSLPLTLRDLP